MLYTRWTISHEPTHSLTMKINIHNGFLLLLFILSLVVHNLWFVFKDIKYASIPYNIKYKIKRTVYKQQFFSMSSFNLLTFSTPHINFCFPWNCYHTFLSRYLLSSEVLFYSSGTVSLNRYWCMNCSIINNCLPQKY